MGTKGQPAIKKYRILPPAKAITDNTGTDNSNSNKSNIPPISHILSPETQPSYPYKKNIPNTSLPYLSPPSPPALSQKHTNSKPSDRETTSPSQPRLPNHYKRRNSLDSLMQNINDNTYFRTATTAINFDQLIREKINTIVEILSITNGEIQELIQIKDQSIDLINVTPFEKLFKLMKLAKDFQDTLVFLVNLKNQNRIPLHQQQQSQQYPPPLPPNIIPVAITPSLMLQNTQPPTLPPSQQQQQQHQTSPHYISYSVPPGESNLLPPLHFSHEDSAAKKRQLHLHTEPGHSNKLMKLPKSPIQKTTSSTSVGKSPLNHDEFRELPLPMPLILEPRTTSKIVTDDSSYTTLPGKLNEKQEGEESRAIVRDKTLIIPPLELQENAVRFKKQTTDNESSTSEVRTNRKKYGNVINLRGKINKSKIKRRTVEELNSETEKEKNHETEGEEEEGSNKKCYHCASSKTPEWRTGPYGVDNICNACGLFYRKVVMKFGLKGGNLLMRYRRLACPTNRRVPSYIEIPEEYMEMFNQDKNLGSVYETLETTIKSPALS